MLAAGDVTSMELVECYLERIEELNPVLNSYITVATDFAVATAREADARRAAGGDVPRFLGVPISIKDLADTAGIVSTHGTAEWRTRVPDRDDEVVAKLRAAGFVFLGKTVVPEFGPLNISEPPGYPPGRNPWNPELNCGGSSGGAAACARRRHVPGVARFRRRRLDPQPLVVVRRVRAQATTGSHLPRPASAEHVLDRRSDHAHGRRRGGVARRDVRVRERRRVLGTAADRPFLDEVGADPGRLRVAFHPHPGVERDECAPANRKAAEDTARLLADLGHDVEEAVPAGYGDPVATSAAVIFAAEHAAAAELVPYPPLDTLDPWMKTLIEMGKAVPATEYSKALHGLSDMSRRTVVFFDDYDLFVSPTLALPPPTVGSMAGAGFEDMMRFLALTPFTALWNTTGQPAVSLPLAHDEEGLPVGVQIVARPAAEATLLRVCAQVEAARPWRDRRPPVS